MHDLITNVTLVLGLFIAVMSISGLRRARRERLGLPVSLNPFTPADQKQWLTRIIRVRVAGLIVGIFIVITQIWHQWFTHNHPPAP